MQEKHIRKPLIGIVSKPLEQTVWTTWKYNEIVDELREALIDNGARVISIVPQGNSVENQYSEYPWYEKSDHFDIIDLPDQLGHKPFLRMHETKS